MNNNQETNQDKGTEQSNYSINIEDSRVYDPNLALTETNPYINRQPATATSTSLFDIDTDQFLKGVLIGAAAAFFLTNEKAQNMVMKGVAKGADMFNVGMEEMKEKFEDAKAELEAEKAEKGE